MRHYKAQRTGYLSRYFVDIDAIRYLLSRSALLIVLLVILLFNPNSSLAWTGQVVGVADGDTISVLHDGAKESIRLYGIDTPEKKQAYGNQAKKATNALVRGKVVEVNPIETDRYGRTVALVGVDGYSLNATLISAGYAWVYRKYCKKDFCDSWYALESAAKSQRKGMWQDPNIMPPWEWRNGPKNNTAYAGSPSVGQSSPQYAASATNSAGPYHGNVKSKKFHRPGCSSYNCKNCTAVFSTREEAIAAGYAPCGNCRP